MAQRTLVLKVPPGRQAALESRLQAGAFEWRRVPHARFSVRGDGTVATLYTSGKLVVQGSDPEGFLARWTDLDVSAEAPGGTGGPGSADRVAALDEPTVGSDETGKGDYFGPLVVAAVRVEPGQAAALQSAGVTDSKRLTDGTALRLATAIRRLPHAVRRLDPADYNRAHARRRNLNPMLADLHAQAIAAVARDGDRVLVDRFADEEVMRTALAGEDVRLEQAPRAERNPAVAAASVLARAEFLLALRELSAEWDVELRKGAGEPTDAAGARFVRAHGEEALEHVAKLHFKNTAKVLRKAGR